MAATQPPISHGPRPDRNSAEIRMRGPDEPGKSAPCPRDGLWGRTKRSARRTSDGVLPGTPPLPDGRTRAARTRVHHKGAQGPASPSLTRPNESHMPAAGSRSCPPDFGQQPLPSSAFVRTPSAQLQSLPNRATPAHSTPPMVARRPASAGPGRRCAMGTATPMGWVWAGGRCSGLLGCKGLAPPLPGAASGQGTVHPTLFVRIIERAGLAREGGSGLGKFARPSPRSPAWHTAAEAAERSGSKGGDPPLPGRWSIAAARTPRARTSSTCRSLQDRAPNMSGAPSRQCGRDVRGVPRPARHCRHGR